LKCHVYLAISFDKWSSHCNIWPWKRSLFCDVYWDRCIKFKTGLQQMIALSIWLRIPGPWCKEISLWWRQLWYKGVSYCFSRDTIWQNIYDTLSSVCFYGTIKWWFQGVWENKQSPLQSCRSFLSHTVNVWTDGIECRIYVFYYMHLISQLLNATNSRKNVEYKSEWWSIFHNPKFIMV
jgi:hypothetical protein